MVRGKPFEFYLRKEERLEDINRQGINYKVQRTREREQ